MNWLWKGFVFLFVMLNGFAKAQMTENQLDSLMNYTIESFDVPGISLGIVQDGKVIYAKGKGVRSLTSKQPMDQNTLVGIASNSKGFTCFALALLVDEGKLKWDDKVTKYIPEFALSDSCVTQEFTVRDLVTHRSGLSLGAGDLLFFPEGNKLTVNEMISRFKYLKPESSFRSEFQYNNNMFIVAGEVLHRISGLTWAEFIEEKIMKPVGMINSKGSYNRITDKSNIIDAHAPVDGKIVAIPHDWSPNADAAGGIVSNIPDMLVWAEFLMNGGVTKDGKRIISEEQMHELWTLQTPIPVAPNNSYNTHFNGYGLGWFLSDQAGTFEVNHSGGLLGTVTKFTLFPDKKLGIVILTNQQSGAAFSAINNAIKDSYLGYENRDWVGKYGKRMNQLMQNFQLEKDSIFAAQKLFVKQNKNLKLEQFAGTYRDAWLGNLEITKKGKSFEIKIQDQPQLQGELLPYNANTWIAKWNNRSFDADAFLFFNCDDNGNPISFTMKPISDITDFSFDFVDVDFKKIN